MNTCPTCGKPLLVWSPNGYMLSIDTSLFCQCPAGGTLILSATLTTNTGTAWINPTVNNGFIFLPPPEPEHTKVPDIFYDAFSDEEVQP